MTAVAKLPTSEWLPKPGFFCFQEWMSTMSWMIKETLSIQMQKIRKIPHRPKLMEVIQRKRIIRKNAMEKCGVRGKHRIGYYNMNNGNTVINEPNKYIISDPF